MRVPRVGTDVGRAGDAAAPRPPAALALEDIAGLGSRSASRSPSHLPGRAGHETRRSQAVRVPTLAPASLRLAAAVVGAIGLGAVGAPAASAQEGGTQQVIDLAVRGLGGEAAVRNLRAFHEEAAGRTFIF